MATSLVVTRHPALVQYLLEKGIIGPGADEEFEVVEHATAETVRGRRVVGVLPLHLTAEAASITTVELDIPAELRGKELNLEQVRQFASAIRTYVVREEK